MPDPTSNGSAPKRLSPEESSRLSAKVRRIIEDGVKTFQQTRHPDGRLKTREERAK